MLADQAAVALANARMLEQVRTLAYYDSLTGLPNRLSYKERLANALEKVRRAARSGENTMPATIDAVRAYATLGEVCDALRDVYGLYEEPAF